MNFRCTHNKWVKPQTTPSTLITIRGWRNYSIQFSHMSCAILINWFTAVFKILRLVTFFNRIQGCQFIFSRSAPTILSTTDYLSSSITNIESAPLRNNALSCIFDIDSMYVFTEAKGRVYSGYRTSIDTSQKVGVRWKKRNCFLHHCAGALNKICICAPLCCHQHTRRSMKSYQLVAKNNCIQYGILRKSTRFLKQFE